jgi:hypothetical protein
MLTGPARLVGFLAPESSPLRRTCRCSPSGARTRPSRTPAQVVTGMTKRPDQEIGLGRRPARMGRIGRLRVAVEVLENPFDDRWIGHRGEGFATGQARAPSALCRKAPGGD